MSEIELLKSKLKEMKEVSAYMAKSNAELLESLIPYINNEEKKVLVTMTVSVMKIMIRDI
jgi:hypothetical protein